MSRPLEILIDARRPTHALPLFGMPLLERVLRAIQEAGLEATRITVLEAAEASGRRGAPPLPDALRESLPLHFEATQKGLAPRLASAARSGPVLALEGDAVVDPRLLAHLAGRPDAAVLCGEEEGEAQTALVHLSRPPRAEVGEADSLVELARAGCQAGDLDRVPREEVPDYIVKLRRRLPAYAFRVVDGAARDRAERRLFWWNYKGSTDFFTRYVYPPLVWPSVRFLARRRVHPNWISALNVLLALGAVPLFAMALWVPGLLMAWTMSVLDSVDGKLARLTYRASPLGNVLDHGLDIVHPPLWYLAWAWPLAERTVAGPIAWAAGLLVGGYVLDRLVTVAFKLVSERRLARRRSIHAWRPLDVRARTFISRRNINLPVFTLALPLGAAVAAFYAIALWQLATLLFHAVRLAQLASAPPSPAPSGEPRAEL